MASTRVIFIGFRPSAIGNRPDKLMLVARLNPRNRMLVFSSRQPKADGRQPIRTGLFKNASRTYSHAPFGGISTGIGGGIVKMAIDSGCEGWYLHPAFGTKQSFELCCVLDLREASTALPSWVEATILPDQVVTGSATPVGASQ